MPPSAPTDLKISNTYVPSHLSIAWQDNSANEDGFKVEKSTDGVNFTEVAATQANGTATNFFNIAPNGTYYFRVYAYNAAGRSEHYSNTLVVNTTIPAPTNLTAAVISKSEVQLSWQNSYINTMRTSVERSLTANGPFAEVAHVQPSQATSYNDTVPVPGTYYYRVRIMSAGNPPTLSGYSNTASCMTVQFPRRGH